MTDNSNTNDCLAQKICGTKNLIECNKVCKQSMTDCGFDQKLWPSYCPVTCRGATATTGINCNNKTSLDVWQQCSSKHKVNDCYPGELDVCINEGCGNLQVCLSDTRKWANNFCYGSNDYPGGNNAMNVEKVPSFFDNINKKKYSFVFYIAVFILFLLIAVFIFVTNRRYST